MASTCKYCKVTRSMFVRMTFPMRLRILEEARDHGFSDAGQVVIAVDRESDCPILNREPGFIHYRPDEDTNDPARCRRRGKFEFFEALITPAAKKRWGTKK